MERINPMDFMPEGAAAAEIEIKKSRFIASVWPVMSPEEAQNRLEYVRGVHPTASHHCFAYTCGWAVPVERFADAGEPSGSAGMPILEVVRRRQVRNTLVVVTRYFGGTLLGAAGLTRAYAQAAAAGLDAATLLRMVPMQPVRVRCDYGWLGKLEYGLTQQGHTLFDKQYAEDVQFRLWTPTSDVDALLAQLNEWTAGQIHTEVSDAGWVGISPDGSFRFNYVGIQSPAG